jgi:putative chitinase
MENGWPECDPQDCDTLTIPGTPLKLLIQRGFPHIVLQAFFRDVDAFNEPCMNARGVSDEGSWTQDNSVYTSNHKGATAVDWNWEDHTFRVADAGWDGSILIQGSQIPQMRELLAWYEGMVFWGNDWDSPKDGMHFQMGYNTAGPENAARVQNFIDRKIRADGYSTYRRGGTARGGGVTPPVAVPVTHGFTPEVLRKLMHNRPSLDRCRQLLPVLLGAFKYAEVNTIDRRAMAIAQLGHESVDLLYQSEIWGPTAQQLTYQGRMGNTNPGDGSRYRGRDFLQITGKDNYASLSRWAYSINAVGVPSPTFFVDFPEKLATDEFAFLGFAWYWKVSRTGLNAAADARNVDEATWLINGGYTGLDDRKRRYNEALAVNADLLNPTDDDDDEEDGVLQTSRSIYRTSNAATMSGSDASRGADATSHMNWVEQSAIRGEAWAIQLVAATAKGGVGATKWWEVNEGNRNPAIDPWAVQKALSVMNYIAAVNPAALKSGASA